MAVKLPSSLCSGSVQHHYLQNSVCNSIWGSMCPALKDTVHNLCTSCMKFKDSFTCNILFGLQHYSLYRSHCQFGSDLQWCVRTSTKRALTGNPPHEDPSCLAKPCQEITHCRQTAHTHTHTHTP